jgi:hypothetical protein
MFKLLAMSLFSVSKPLFAHVSSQVIEFRSDVRMDTHFPILSQSIAVRIPTVCVP